MIHLNSQGDKGNSALTTLSSKLTMNLYEQLELNLSYTCYMRRSEYEYFPTVTYSASETKIGITYRVE